MTTGLGGWPSSCSAGPRGWVPHGGHGRARSARDDLEGSGSRPSASAMCAISSLRLQRRGAGQVTRHSPRGESQLPKECLGICAESGAGGTRPGTSRHPDSRDERRRHRRTRGRNWSAQRQGRPGRADRRHRRCGRTGPVRRDLPAGPNGPRDSPRSGGQCQVGRGGNVGSAALLWWDRTRPGASQVANVRGRFRRVFSHLTPALAPARARPNSSRDETPPAYLPTLIDWILNVPWLPGRALTRSTTKRMERGAPVGSRPPD